MVLFCFREQWIKRRDVWSFDFGLPTELYFMFRSKGICLRGPTTCQFIYIYIYNFQFTNLGPFWSDFPQWPTGLLRRCCRWLELIQMEDERIHKWIHGWMERRLSCLEHLEILETIYVENNTIEVVAARSQSEFPSHDSHELPSAQSQRATKRNQIPTFLELLIGFKLSACFYPKLAQRIKGGFTERILASIESILW